MTRQRLPEATRNGRRLRRQLNDIERLLWWRIRRSGLDCHYRRQAPIGAYVADFACLTHRLVIECDGNHHFDSTHDRQRDAYLKQRGFRVLRLWDWEIIFDLEDAVWRIRRACHGEPPSAG